jgi:hypothetical protein
MTEVEKSLEKDGALTERINAKYREVEDLARSTVEAGIELGKMLVEKKEALGHGEWLPWLRENFEGSERHAQRFMRLYSERDRLLSNATRVSDLSLSGALEALATPRIEPPPLDVPATLPSALENGAREPTPESPAVLENGVEAQPPRELGVIERAQMTPEGRAALAEADNEFMAEGLYLKMRSKIHDLYSFSRHMTPEEAARREFAHHAADIARDTVRGRSYPRNDRLTNQPEAVREWLGKYIQCLKDAEARLQRS